MERYYILFKGTIQGVGFRNYVKICAINHHLTGSCRNLDNGHVEVYFQGDKKAILKAIQILVLGNMFIKVKDYQMKKIPLCESEKSFKIHY